MLNEGLILELNNAKEYFNSKREVFDKYEQYLGNKEGIERFREGGCLISILGFVGFFVYCWKCFEPFRIWFMENSTTVQKIFNSIRGWFDKESLFGDFFIVVFWFLSWIICYIVLYIALLFLLAVSVQIIKRIITIPAYKKNIAKIDNTFNELTNIYNEYERTTGRCCPVPFDRSHPEAIKEITEIINSNRADSVKDAINIIISDQHNSKMEVIGKARLEQEKIRNKHLKKISKDINAIKWSWWI